MRCSGRTAMSAAPAIAHAAYSYRVAGAFTAASSSQEEAVCGIAGLVGVVVAQVAEEAAERGAPLGGNLQAHQHAPHVGPVVAVVEERDVPVAAHVGEEVHERAGTFGELEAVEHLLARLARSPAHEVAHVQ